MHCLVIFLYFAMAYGLMSAIATLRIKMTICLKNKDFFPCLMRCFDIAVEEMPTIGALTVKRPLSIRRFWAYSDLVG